MVRTQADPSRIPHVVNQIQREGQHLVDLDRNRHVADRHPLRLLGQVVLLVRLQGDLVRGRVVRRTFLLDRHGLEVQIRGDHDLVRVSDRRRHVHGQGRVLPIRHDGVRHHVVVRILVDLHDRGLVPSAQRHGVVVQVHAFRGHQDRDVEGHGLGGQRLVDRLVRDLQGRVIDQLRGDLVLY